MKRTSSRAIRLALYFLRPFRALFAGILAVTVLASFFEGLNIAAFFPFLQSLLDPTHAPMHSRLYAVLARWSPRNMLPDPVVASAVLIIAMICCKTAATFLREALIAQGSGRVLYRVKEQLMRRYATAPYQFFLDTKQEALLYNTLLAPHKVAILTLRLPQLIAELLTIATLVCLLFIVWPAAAIGLMGIAFLYASLTHLLSKRVSYNIGEGRAAADTEQVGLCQEFLNGIRHIKAFRTAEHWLGRFRHANRRYTALYVNDALWLAIPPHAMEFTAVCVLVGAVAVLQLAAPGLIGTNLPALGIFTLAVVRLLPALTSFGRKHMEMLSTLADAERVHAELTPPHRLPQEGARIFTTLRSAIQFEDVSFTHQRRDELLNHLSLTMERGTMTAIVGPSGAGKTTLINLLLGLYEPTAGRILVDGLDLRDYRRETWLKQIGFVSQDPFIYHATIADNIRFGRVGYPDEALVRAAHMAYAHEFITALPQGYRTIVGERGMKLSGGQQQRLAIARALLSEPEILLFDEATSHLDAASERQVQAAIERIAQDRTVIVVAHRLSTIQGAQRIVVLERGRIVEKGSHEQLLQERGRYFQLVSPGTGADAS